MNEVVAPNDYDPANIDHRTADPYAVAALLISQELSKSAPPAPQKTVRIKDTPDVIPYSYGESYGNSVPVTEGTARNAAERLISFISKKLASFLGRQGGGRSGVQGSGQEGGRGRGTDGFSSDRIVRQPADAAPVPQDSPSESARFKRRETAQAEHPLPAEVTQMLKELHYDPALFAGAVDIFPAAPGQDWPLSKEYERPVSEQLRTWPDEARITVAAAAREIIDSNPDVERAFRQGRLGETLDFLRSTSNPESAIAAGRGIAADLVRPLPPLPGAQAPSESPLGAVAASAHLRPPGFAAPPVAARAGSAPPPAPAIRTSGAINQPRR